MGLNLVGLVYEKKSINNINKYKQKNINKFLRNLLFLLYYYFIIYFIIFFIINDR